MSTPSFAALCLAERTFAGALPPRLLLIPLYTALGRPGDAADTAAAVLAVDPAQGPTARTLVSNST